MEMDHLARGTSPVRKLDQAWQETLANATVRVSSHGNHAMYTCMKATIHDAACNRL